MKNGSGGLEIALSGTLRSFGDKFPVDTPSVGRLAGIACRWTTRFLVCYCSSVLQMFFDGSGKSEDPNCRFLTLAGVLAEEPVWSEWSEKWKKILDEYGVEYCHMKELFQKDKGQFQGWGHERKRKFVLALLQSLNYAERMKMICTSPTIDLTAYRRLAVLKALNPKSVGSTVKSQNFVPCCPVAPRRPPPRRHPQSASAGR